MSGNDFKELVLRQVYTMLKTLMGEKVQMFKKKKKETLKNIRELY